MQHERDRRLLRAIREHREVIIFGGRRPPNLLGGGSPPLGPSCDSEFLLADVSSVCESCPACRWEMAHGGAGP